MKDRDCMTANYDYEELAKAYQNFLAPAVAVYVDNRKQNVITDKGIAIDSISVTLSAADTASLSFQVINAFDLETKKFRENIRSVFSVGTIIEVAMGYGSDLTSVFKGYVEEYKTSYQAVPVVLVTALDVRKLLKQNKRKKYSYKDKTYSDIFEEIMKSYKDLYGTLHVDSTNDPLELIQDDSDYNFIKDELCRKAKRDFFVVGEHIYFKKPEAKAASFLELEWGKSLISFQSGSSYCNKQFKAYSMQEDHTRNEASKEVKTEDGTPSLKSSIQIEEMELGENLSNMELENYIEQKASEEKRRTKTAGGTLIGLPEIVPGRYIKISGVDSSDAGDYYITEVRHNFGSDGFTTSFTVGTQKDNLVAGEHDRQRMQDSRYRGVLRAIVRENWDVEQPGKVLVEFLTGETGKNSTKWLPVLHPYCGDGYGFYFHPEIGSEVVVGSMAGDVNSLVVMGSLWNKVNRIPEETAEEKNAIKRIRTKAQHEIAFWDDEENGQIQISTKCHLHFVLNDKEKTISVFDEEEKNGLLIDSKNGIVKLEADKKIILSAGQSEMLVMEAQGKKIALQADKITEEGKQSIQIEGNSLAIKGTQTEIKANGSMKLTSSGIAEVKGSLVKIN
ncbi:MAG: phage baseplate assembly protein V [Clostridium sp.]|nr:phage baseplate assembly protein V [Clostridium sp.]